MTRRPLVCWTHRQRKNGGPGRVLAAIRTLSMTNTNSLEGHILTEDVILARFSLQELLHKHFTIQGPRLLTYSSALTKRTHPLRSTWKSDQGGCIGSTLQSRRRYERRFCTMLPPETREWRVQRSSETSLLVSYEDTTISKPKA